MRVGLYANLRAAVGEKYVQVPVAEGASVGELVAATIDAHPELRELVLEADGSVQKAIHVFVNGRGAVYLPDGFDTQLAPEDEIDLIPAAAGG